MWRNPRWRAVSAAFFFNGLIIGSWASRIPAFKAGFDLGPASLSLLLLALAGGALLAFPIGGMLTEKYGAAKITFWALALAMPLLMWVGWAPSLVSFAISLMALGAVIGAMDVAMNGWAAEVETASGRAIMPIFHAIFSIGAGIGAICGYGAVKLGAAPLTQYALIGLPLWAIAVAVVWPQSHDAPPAASDTKAPLLAIPKGALAFVGLIGFAFTLTEGAMIDWSGIYLEDILRTTEAQAALGLAVFNTVMVITRLAGEQLIRRFGAVRLAQISSGLAALGLITVVLSPSLAVALSGFGLVAVGCANIFPLCMTRAANDPHIRPGPGIASVATLIYGGILIGPPLVGFIAEAVGLQASFLVLAALCFSVIGFAPKLELPK